MNPLNVVRAAANRLRKLARQQWRERRRDVKTIRESAKHVNAQIRRGGDISQDALQQAYSASVKTGRVWRRLAERAWDSTALELSVRRELTAVAAGDRPIIVGPWISEVGYEALYWVAFVRWFADRFRVDRSRLVVVSRGGTAGWYSDITDRYVEILDLVPADEFARRGAERRESGDQKQFTLSPFEADIVARAQASLGSDDAAVLHPSTMFRLFRRFWLGTESLQHVLDHTLYRPLAPAPVAGVPALPDAFVAVKCYNGRALPDATRGALSDVLGRVRDGRPIVLLSSGVSLDEHEDHLFQELPDVIPVGAGLPPGQNLAIQTEVIRRASLFVGTCGSLAWLAPMLGTETLALYEDGHFLKPHLYAASLIYPAMGAARFTPVDLHAVQAMNSRN